MTEDEKLAAEHHTSAEELTEAQKTELKDNPYGDQGDTSVAAAKVMLPPGADPEMPAGDYRATKRGNDPANPKYARGVPLHDEGQTVKLSRVTPDSPVPVYTWVHPDMVGDYLRAGWGRE